MKIITWNCNMAFRKKAEWILLHNPDILIVPECEHPARLKFPAHIAAPNSIFWYGDNPNKGLGVFSYSTYQFKLYKSHNPAYKTIVPLKVTGGDKDFTLFAIWANNPADKLNPYIGQIWKAINYYDSLIKSRRTILAGDFNSNTIWDRPRRVGNHSDLVNALQAKKISSVYHHHFNQAHGKEDQPTFNLYKNFEKPYHLDYCFASKDLIAKLKQVEIGNYNHWKPYSDHLPLIVEFDI